MRLRSAAAAALLLACTVLVTTPSGAQSDTGAEPATTTTTLDLLPPEVPPTRRTLPPATELPTTTTTSTTTTTVVTPSDGPGLGPVCASRVGAEPSDRAKPCRIIAFYGTPAAPTMGILGRLPRATMPATLAATAQLWRTADPSVTTACAFEVIVSVAQGSPGPGGLYRGRLGPAQIDSMIALARTSGCLTLLDLQVGRSSVPDELPYFRSWLAQPDVHLALDPEWDMPPDVTPGTRIGSMTADDINSAITTVSDIVRQGKLPPKLVVVHRFRDFMISLPQNVRPTPEIRLLVNMDGFGAPTTKLASYARVRNGLATNLTGFKLFTRNDRPMLGPGDVLGLTPVPMFVNYQ